MAQERPWRPKEQHANRCVRTYSALGGISAMGLGNGRQRAGTFFPEAIWLCNSFERAHSPNHAEGGRKHHIPHRELHRISPAAARPSGLSGPDEGADGETEQ